MSSVYRVALSGDFLKADGTPVFPDFDLEPLRQVQAWLTLDNVILGEHALCWTDQCLGGNGAADVKAVLDVQHGRTRHLVINRAVLDSERWRSRMADFRSRFGNK